jgi:hypothetical protein
MTVISYLKIRKYVVHKSKKPYDIYIGRPSKWGNPFSTKEGTPDSFKVEDRDEAIDKFEVWVRSQPEMMNAIKKELCGKVLGCWCDPNRCHGHVLAWIANEETYE